MNYQINQDTETITDSSRRSTPLYSSEGFRILSDLWLKVGWNQKHLYSFSWLGRPMIQLPEDVHRIQEVIYQIKPDVIVETGVAHGGSLVFYASLCKLMDNGKVIGVDIEIRPHNREAIEAHSLFNLITLIEGDSTSSEIVASVKQHINPSDSVMVILDSNHTYQHVINEIREYSSIVTEGSYIVVTDGSQAYLNSTPRARMDYPGYAETWGHNNPLQAINDFTKGNPDFRIVEPEFPFNEGNIDFRVTYWPSCYLQKATS